MRIYSYSIGESHDGMKIGDYLRRTEGVSYRLLKKLKQVEDGITLNAVHARTIDQVHTGDTLAIRLYDTGKEMQPCAITAEILYEDDDVIVYNKPFDVPCHQAKRHQDGTLAHIFAQHCHEQGEARTFRCINRLDRNTTGAVVIAKNAHSANMLTGGVDKYYIAVVSGQLEADEGIIEENIARLNDRSTIRVVSPNGSEGQYARTDFTVLERHETYTVVKCVLHTGRTHQIRVHFAHLGHPLLGDDLYGGPQDIVSRQALHCCAVWFAHPDTGERMFLEAPMFEDMQKLLKTAQ